MRGKQNNREIGSFQEQRAKAYLEAQGVNIIAQNFRCRSGEIDLIGRDGKYLVFVEVKYRKGGEGMLPEEAVNYTKQRKICRVADYYRYRYHIGEAAFIRYDVVALTEKEIRWHKNAFMHVS